MSNAPHFFHFPLSKDQNIAKKKQAKLPPRRDPIVTRSRAREMSSSGTSPHEENAQEITLLKKQMSEVMRTYACFVGRWLTMGIIYLCFARFFLIVL